MITLTELETILIACLPSLTAIVSIVTAVSTIIKSLNKLKDNEALKQERDALLEQNKKVIAECRAMKKQIALYIEKASHIVYNDLSEVQNDKEIQI